jgi:hypothetical protein
VPLVVVWDGVGLAVGVLGGGLSVELGAGVGCGALEVADGVGCGLGALVFVGPGAGVPLPPELVVGLADGLPAAVWPAARRRCLDR